MQLARKLSSVLMLLNLNEDLTQAVHAFAASEVKPIQHTLHEAKPSTDWLPAANTAARFRGLSIEHALLSCSLISTIQFSH